MVAKLSRHAAERARQRGATQAQILAVNQCIRRNGLRSDGSHSAEAALSLRVREMSFSTRVKTILFRMGVVTIKHDEITDIKYEIHQLERIRNKKIVVYEDELRTGYRLSRRHERRCLQRLRGRTFRLRKGR